MPRKKKDLKQVWEQKKEPIIVITNNNESKEPIGVYTSSTNESQIEVPWINVSSTRRKDKEPKVVEVECNNGFESLLALLETRVKLNNRNLVRKKLGFEWDFIDSYEHHNNGRIWLTWNPNIWNMKAIDKTDQLVHAEVFSNTWVFSHYLTIIYAQNQLVNRKKLWDDIDIISRCTTGPWICVGDFNNVLKVGDRIGGNKVHITEYMDMERMMNDSGLFEHETTGPFFTWSNRQTVNPICSKIDRVLINVVWFTAFPNSIVEVLNPYISYHSPLRIKMDTTQHTCRRKQRFKFLNCVTDHPDFLSVLRTNWIQHETGAPMYHLWKNLQRLQFYLKGLNWKTTEGIKNLKERRMQLEKAQNILKTDHINPALCQSVKHWTEEPRAKEDCIKLGDGNNSYFYAKLKAKNNQTHIKQLKNALGQTLTEPEDLEKEVLDFYTNLIGQTAPRRRHVDITLLRNGAQLNRDHKDSLTNNVAEEEIWQAVKSMGDNKAPGADGYTAKKI
ncbi:uncharacterized protein LOC131624433 [Vicia villosa]|uniref:uncharacterized protein LOC131624433 n=1 Tax=Vicia villosa TaxID=3911 RepID=UPI00273BE48B|nr:uncharacterized protein LOC131624433 [Vicia villosa]